MNFEVGSMIFQLLIFIVLYFFLKRFAFDPLMKMMNERQGYIEKQISTAEQNRAEAEKLAAEHKAAIQASKKEASDLLENARRTGEKQATDIIAAAETEAKRIKAEALTDIQREKEQAIAELREQVGNLSVMLAGKIITKEIDAQAHHVLFEEAVKEMGERVC